jgi:hypothetical protein
VRGSHELLSQSPSSDANFVRATFFHKGRRKKELSLLATPTLSGS